MVSSLFKLRVIKNGILASIFEFSEELSAQTAQGVTDCLAIVEQLIRGK
jgi:hypothetical protein